MRIVTITILLIGTIISSCNNDQTLKEGTWEGFIKESRDEGLLINDKFYIYNNVTGKYTPPYSETYTQNVFLKKGNTWSCGWEWDLKGENVIPFYPEIIYGLNPWWEESTTRNLPDLLSEFTSIKISFKKDFEAKGRYNSAFDIWLCTEPDPEPPSETNTGNIYSEVMIWIDTTETVGLTAIRTVTIKNNTYDLYFIKGYPSYIAFVSRNEHWAGTINLIPFLNYLEDNNYIPAGLYISAIEFGNEIWSGKGYMKIKDYSVELIR